MTRRITVIVTRAHAAEAERLLAQGGERELYCPTALAIRDALGLGTLHEGRARVIVGHGGVWVDGLLAAIPDVQAAAEVVEWFDGEDGEVPPPSWPVSYGLELPESAAEATGRLTTYPGRSSYQIVI